MRFRVITQGNDGTRHYEPGDEGDRASEWAARMLVNGLADPLDDEARKLVEHPGAREQHGDRGLQAEAHTIRKLAARAAPKKGA